MTNKGNRPGKTMVKIPYRHILRHGTVRHVKLERTHQEVEQLLARARINRTMPAAEVIIEH